MMWFAIIASVFLVSAILTGVVIPQILLISFRRKLFDEVDERKIHKGAVPRLGGMAFMPAIVFSLCLVCGTLMVVGPYMGTHPDSVIQNVFITPGASSLLVPLCMGLCSLMLMYLIGMADDLIGLQYRAKFASQILAGLLLAVAGLRIDSLNGMFGIHELPEVVSWLLTVFLTVFFTNAINLVDGIDGLASGLSAIAMVFYGLFFLGTCDYVSAMIAFAALGTLVPFFYYNVFGSALKQKKIFMGDTGSLSTGIVLSFLSLRLAGVADASLTTADNLVVAFSPLAIPCLDVVRVFVHRVIRGHSPFLPDRSHIHHKLLALGFPPRPAMVAILASSAGTIGLNLMLSPVLSTISIVAVDLMLWIGANYLLTKAVRQREVRDGVSHGYE